MGRGKRKTRERQGGRARGASSVKPKPFVGDLELQEREDPDLILGGDRADGDPLIEEAGGLTSVGGDSDEGPTAYLVACHWDWSSYSKPYPVYKVDAPLSDASSPSGAKRRRLSRAARLATVAGGKTFTSVRSVRRAWVVGVGGEAGGSVIFDTKAHKVIHGPDLTSAKWCPVLMAVGDRVYALSKTPSWISDPDFPHWFEVLDLSQARVVTVDHRFHLEGCSWVALPHPPCLPWKLTPIGYTMLPVVIVMSYVVVNPYILVSFNQPWGTYAFDTSSHDPYQWHKVDDKRLPFIGGAIPHGSIFLGLSKKKGPINAYLINLTISEKDHVPKLSITALPVKYMDHEVDAGPYFSCLDDGRFCSMSFSLDSSSITLHPKNLELYPKKAHVNLTSYQIENRLLLETPEALLAVKPEIEISSQWEQAFEISSSHGFSPFCFTLLSV